MPLSVRRQRETVLLEGTRFAFKPNFEGREEQFNREGDRYFNVELTAEQADDLIAQGWNVKTWKSKDAEDDELPVYFLKVAVSYKIRPPRVVLITSKGRTPLDEETCDMVDWLELDFIDVTIEGNNWNVNGRSGKKAYLKTIMLIVREDELEKKYAHLPEVGVDPILAIEPRDDVVDGEVVAEWEDEAEFLDQVKDAESRRAITA